MDYRLPVLLIAAALATACARPLPPEDPLAVSPVSVGEGEQRVATNLFLVTDASGTMYGRKTFPKAKALSESLIMALPDTDARGVTREYNVATIGFGGDERAGTELQRFDRGQALAQVQRLELMGSIDGLGGATPLHEVIAEIGAAVDSKAGATTIVLFTDGLPDDPAATLAAARALAESRRSDTCFHAVQLGDDAPGGTFLRDLGASSRCGSSRRASSIDDVASFERFARRVVVGGAAGAALPAVSAAPVGAAGCGSIRLRGIEFGFDDTAVDESGAAVLDVAAEMLEECGGVAVDVEGHSDSTGPAAYNQGLSERRAGAVKQYLSGRGIDEDRLSPKGVGEARPVSTNDTREGRARNRRVELNPR